VALDSQSANTTKSKAMSTTEFFEDPIKVTGSMDAQGQVTLQRVTWQGHQHTVVGIGRQWDDETGRRLMVETADGAHLEIQLRREDLIWYVRRVWRQQMAA
jgi:hypothetical protein